MDKNQKEKVMGFRVGKVAQIVGISSRQINRWCQDGAFIPQHKVDKYKSENVNSKENKDTKEKVKSPEQRYTISDICHLFIISLLQRTGMISIGEINKLMATSWGDESKELCVLRKRVESRMEYLQCIEKVLQCIDEVPNGLESVFHAYEALIVSSELYVDKTESKVSAVIKQLAHSWSPVSEVPFSAKHSKLRNISNHTGMNVRTLYRVCGNYDEKNFQTEDCYPFFLMKLMQEINPRDYSLYSNKFRNLEIPDMLNFMNETLQCYLQILDGISNLLDDMTSHGIKATVGDFQRLPGNFDERLLYLSQYYNDVTSIEDNACKMKVKSAINKLLTYDTGQSDWELLFGPCSSEFLNACKNVAICIQEWKNLHSTFPEKDRFWANASISVSLALRSSSNLANWVNQEYGNNKASRIGMMLISATLNTFFIPPYNEFLKKLSNKLQTSNIILQAISPEVQAITADFFRSVAPLYNNKDPYDVYNHICNAINLIGTDYSGVEESVIDKAKESIAYYLKVKKNYYETVDNDR